MKKILLASAALLTLVLAGPANAAHDNRDGQGAATHQGGGHQGGGHQGGGHPGGGQGGHQTGGRQGGGHQAGGQGGSLSILAPGGTGGHRNRGGHNNTGATTGGSNPFAGRGGHNNNTGATMGGSNPFAGRGSHAGRGHNSAFDSLRRVFNAPHHYRHGSYNRPHGWYAHRWNYGEFLPSLFFSRNYWISDYSDFDLSDPPPGTTWVRYGDDALLIDEYTGEVIQVVYGIFY